MLKKILRLSKNFYFVSGLCFLLWMLFFDTNDFYSQYQLSRQVKRLKAHQAHYQEKIRQVNADRKALMNDEELLERLCREKYFMKKKDEDVFVTVRE